MIQSAVFRISLGRRVVLRKIISPEEQCVSSWLSNGTQVPRGPKVSIVFLKLGHDDRTLSPVGRANHVIVFKRPGILIYVAQEGRNEVCGIRD